MSKLEKTGLNNGHEILFVCDITCGNPNGDPDRKNKPRMDGDTNIVSPYRFKRTIRDWLNRVKGLEILVRDRTDINSKELFDGKTTAAEFANDPYEIQKKCIDYRLFGAVLPVRTGKAKDSAITCTGPVQFGYGKSLHAVKIITMTGTGAFASDEGKEQRTIRTDYLLPYSLICVDGQINKEHARLSGMTESDRELLMEALWAGTAWLSTTSKFSQVPRLLVDIEAARDGFFMGGLHETVTIDKKKKDGKDILDEDLRTIHDYVLKIEPLFTMLNHFADSIKSVSVRVHPNVELDLSVEQLKEKFPRIEIYEIPAIQS
ncbi:MAG: type I-B CRISPR-associated protein Cas7/Csh2 [Candidatus Odinarchaeota archaeon]